MRFFPPEMNFGVAYVSAVCIRLGVALFVFSKREKYRNEKIRSVPISCFAVVSKSKFFICGTSPIWIPNLSGIVSCLFSPFFFRFN